MKKNACFLIGVLTAVFVVFPGKGYTQRIDFKTTKRRMIADLEQLLLQQKEWVKIHAAEYLLWTGQSVKKVNDVFLNENNQFGDVPKYRIGIWRVLAQAGNTQSARDKWVQKIVTVYHTPDAPDRLHAIETLAKLRFPVAVGDSVAAAAMNDPVNPFAVYSLWNITHAPGVRKDSVQQLLVSLLVQQLYRKDDPLVPVLSYILRYLGPLGRGNWKMLENAVRNTKFPAVRCDGLMSTLWITAPSGKRKAAKKIRKRFLQKYRGSIVNDQVLSGFSSRGLRRDLPWLLRQYAVISDSGREGYNADLHATAAYTVLKILK